LAATFEFLKQINFMQPSSVVDLAVGGYIFNKFLVWKIWKKICGFHAAGFVADGVTIIYIRYALPNIPPVPDIAIDHHDSTLLNGEIPGEHVAICIDCHSRGT